ncbi:MAG: pyruvate kinase [Planctomycetota bacterium]|nr:pyruvate kinase [Planctomycetota bacterium]
MPKKTSPKPRSRQPRAARQAVHDAPKLAQIASELAEIRADMQRLEQAGLAAHPGIHPSYQLSARNLLHYLALRSRDPRALQAQLRRLGLSSLGRCEAHALASIEAVTAVVAQLSGRRPEPAPTTQTRVNIGQGERVLERHADALLGPARAERRVRILVTMPDQAADEPRLVEGWIQRGMDLARINCAHGNPTEWERTAANVRRAAKRAGRACRIFMDLAGPKLRTGPVAAGPAVLKLRPLRDALGAVVAPTRVWLTNASAPSSAPPGCAGALPVDAAWLAALAPADEIGFHDARNAARQLIVKQRTRGGAVCELRATSYFTPGIVLRKRGTRGAAGACRIGEFAARPGEILLSRGDHIVLTRSLEPGRGPQLDQRGRVLTPARIGCTLPAVFEHARVGESVWLDDGKIGGRIVAASGEQLEIEVTSARAAGCKLRADKGINLPDTELALPAFTAKDQADLPFVVEHADMVALSFVHSPSDVQELETRLAELGRPELGIVLKIETRRAFERLPQLLLASMQSPCDGVMIARGDLAVECGFERLAEVQEEILWICEAAHVPVIWATQVLETLAREGRPSRAEITDAAMSERAECVMLNKGPHIDQALTVLDDILRRMQGHQRKKSAMLRPLGLARRPIV